jgi:hypothetical protein
MPRSKDVASSTREGSSPLTIDEAREVLALPERVDYIHGRVMKVDLHREEIEVYLYDQANGKGKHSG